MVNAFQYLLGKFLLIMLMALPNEFIYLIFREFFQIFVNKIFR